MAYNKNKGGKASSGSFMDSGKGMCSYSKNPMKAASRTSAMTGPGMNPDQKKMNGLLQSAQKKVDSLRGMSGM